jgi:hypothetical protein
MAESVSASSAGCAWPGCPSFGQAPATAHSGNTLLQCGRCKQVWYCKKACQKSHWSALHKHTCSGAPRHIVADTTLEALQSCLDTAQPGDVVEIPAGEYRATSSSAGSEATLTINKAVHLLGAGMSKVTLGASLCVAQGSEMAGKLVIANFKIEGHVSVEENKYDSPVFLSVEVSCSPTSRDDAFSIRSCGGKVLLYCCEIIGGSDGLRIYTPNVHIRETDIQCAHSRGIFADYYFIIEDSAVYNCGSYGIKGRGGWHEKGTNELQPGPWGSHGASGMYR